MVVVPNLGAAHAAEKFLCPIGASAVEAVRLLVIDALLAGVSCSAGARGDQLGRNLIAADIQCFNFRSFGSKHILFLDDPSR